MDISIPKEKADYIYADKARLAGPIAVAETPCTEKEQDN